ncbi:hypothetical protein [Streptacidiphilus rugosus]|uniref:hypothetical protein n=1 Tax=Streptacidiphilus rugosus TaxID=405783 RepID=UPI000AAD4C90|nr:hypothetical protein [Streptacidiphilus rugosus]
MKSSLGSAVFFLPPGTPGHVARSWNRAALAAQVAVRAAALGLGADLTVEQMTGLAQVVRDEDAGRPLSPATQEAIRAALRRPLGAGDAPEDIAEAVFTRLPDSPVPVVGADGRRYFLVAVPG